MAHREGIRRFPLSPPAASQSILNPVRPATILACVAAYFAGLLAIAWRTSRHATEAGYFIGEKRSPWFVVAFGLIGDSLSGVTFISVPGQVAQESFGYLQVVLGNALGYLLIAEVLLPLYYRRNLTSIYSFLGERFGLAAQRTGAGFFILSRTLGSAARLYLAAIVFQRFVFDPLGLPFPATVAGAITLILIYTLRGGIKTLVWTDTFQSGFLLLAVLLSILAIARGLRLDAAGVWSLIRHSPDSRIFFWDWRQPNFFPKELLSGAALAVVMNGLDQNNMQKNLSCRSLREAKRNLRAFAAVMVLVNAAFLALGALLYAFARARGVTTPPDELFPTLALRHLGPFAAAVFVIGLTAATFNSADSVLTTLTTSFCVDFLRFDFGQAASANVRARTRPRVHLCFAALLFVAILGFRLWQSGALIGIVLRLAAYTYGPLLGLFALGMLTRAPAAGAGVPLVCVLAPAACWWLSLKAPLWLNGYQFGFELLILNGMLVAAGLWLVGRQGHARAEPLKSGTPDGVS